MEKLNNQIELAKKFLDNNMCIEIDPVYLILVKNENDEYLGFSVFSPKPNQRVYLSMLAIKPKAQSQGLAKHLIFSILDIFPKLESIFLDAVYWNTKARNIYEHFGFKITSISEFTNTFEYKKN
ncbi:GNAT family N-acetyltransferase [Candidatus Dependentiae bacterium]|nr:GNAT family N-acetyltransferase [Candidatus Dependentiae bacterium]MBU4387399.1 GNAT family N-acetyltransferase [Candidatus Dependentiae bacterium]MCG2756782.1 GNAT family N-acetyltransferase [Candidatus Dependentiae bacterium]